MKTTFSSVLKMNRVSVEKASPESCKDHRYPEILFIHRCLCLNTDTSVCSWDYWSGWRRVTIMLLNLEAEARRQADHSRVLRQPSSWITVTSVQNQFQHEKCVEPLIWYENSERTGHDHRRVRALRRVCFTLFVPDPMRHVLTRCFRFNFFLRQRTPSLCFL